MEIDELKSDLRMSNLYFKECSVKRAETIAGGEFKAEIKKNIEKADEHTYVVELTLMIEKEDLNVLVVAEAHFTYEARNYEREESIINANTVAIMFPFIRSQVSLLTTQPGMTPIVLPPINTTKFK